MGKNKGGWGECEGLSWGDKKSWNDKSWLDELNYEYEEPERVATEDQPEVSLSFTFDCNSFK